MRFDFPPNHNPAPMLALRRAILDSPVAVGLARAEAFTRVWQANEGAAWIVKKALALRECFRTVPLYIRPGDLLAGAISETPGAMPVMVELGIAEESVYISEQPQRSGYLAGKVPQSIVDYWEDRNLWGQHRAYMRTVEGKPPERTDATMYKFLSNQGHLSPSYRELLGAGLDGMVRRVRERRVGEIDPASLEFLTSAEVSLLGLQSWIERYAAFLAAEAARCADPGRADQLAAMTRNCERIAHEPPVTFHQAMQLAWFSHQAIHIEGHGYSCTPDRLDQILYPFYRADRDAGQLDDDFALTLCENFLLKQRDNTFWGIEHNLTQGLVVGGSTPDGADQTNELSWLFIKATGEMSLPEPLVWVRWHPGIDPDFFDFCLQNLAGSTCFPLMMSDTAVPEMFMALGASRDDAFDYVPVGCNELGIPGKAYFNPAAHVDYPRALELTLTAGHGYDGRSDVPDIPHPGDLRTFDDLTAAAGRVLRWQVATSYAASMPLLMAQMRWGQTPLTSCFFDGCIERARDLAERTKYNILSCGGSFFANMVDGLAAIREVVYERGDATLEQVAAACQTNFAGQELLRQRLLRAPKHGNDDARLEDLVALVERLRDEPVKEICRDPRDGTPFGNVHITRSSAVRVGARTPATPDGRMAGTPLATSVAAACGVERQGPTAVLKSILQLNPAKSWQCGYNVNLRFQRSVLADPDGRRRLDAMLRAYFLAGGQEMQINSADTAELRAAQAHPERYRDLVVRVAGFSAFFVSLTRDMQDEIIARTEHS
jgi:formate C-acetyltransferase